MDQRIWHTRWVNRNRGAFGSILIVDSSLSSTGPRSLLTPVCSPIESLMPCLSGYHPHPLYVVCLLGLFLGAGKGRRRRIEEAIRLILDCSENRTGV